MRVALYANALRAWEDLTSSGENFYTEEQTKGGQCVYTPFCLGPCGDKSCGRSRGEYTAGESCGSGGFLGWPTSNAALTHKDACPPLTLPSGITISGTLAGDPHCVDKVNHTRFTRLVEDDPNPTW